MNFNNNEVRKVIYNISTRWLILAKCSERPLIQRYSLKSYFMSNFNLDDDSTKHDPDEKPSREKSVVNAFKVPVTKLYAMFVQSVILIFESFNTFLQAEEKMIMYCIILLCVGIADYFQHYPTWSYLRTDDGPSIDSEDHPDVSKDSNSVFIGAMAKQLP